MEFTNFIQETHGVVSEDLCNRIIARFQEDDRKSMGRCGFGLVDEYKISMDLLLSEHPEWDDIDAEVFNVISPYISKYMMTLRDTFGINANNFHDTGYQIQWTTPGGHFLCHSDYDISVLPKTQVRDGDTRYIQVRERVLTYILYLNDRKGVEDGRTIFTIGDTVVPIEAEVGKLLIFPAHSIYKHEGEPLKSGEKYLLTGWGTVDSSSPIEELSEEDLDFLTTELKTINIERKYPNPF